MSAPGTDLIVLARPQPTEAETVIEDIEIHIYEAWAFEAITKDAARHFLAIAAICGWEGAEHRWVEEMREWTQ